MSTLFKRIETWVRDSKEAGYKYMLVIVDSFDHSDYPVGCETEKECMETFNDPGDMQRVMEVYDLSIDIDLQMNENRSWHLPKGEMDVLRNTVYKG